MKVKFSKPKIVNPKHIELLSLTLGEPISENLKTFFVEFNGAKPDVNIFTINQSNESGVNALIPIEKILEERKHLDNIGESVFPVAEAEGGNYVVIDLSKEQSVYFWDHEEPQKMVKLANDIHEFLGALTPFDPASVKLKEGQVESAWIDPDFLKSLK